MKNINYTCDTCQKSSENIQKPSKWIHIDYIQISDPYSFDYPIIVRDSIAGHYCSQNCLTAKLVESNNLNTSNEVVNKGIKEPTIEEKQEAFDYYIGRGRGVTAFGMVKK